jgi:hypothetical protein
MEFDMNAFEQTLGISTQEDDDSLFISRTNKIFLGAIWTYHPHEIYLIKVDNWFDYKWLGFEEWYSSSVLSGGMKTKLPPFGPNRIRYQFHFTFSEENYLFDGSGKDIHGQQLVLTALTPCIFAWYSGNTIQNDRGSLMAYFYPVTVGAERHQWFASFRKKEGYWDFEKGREISPGQLSHFETQGQLVE